MGFEFVSICFFCFCNVIPTLAFWISTGNSGILVNNCNFLPFFSRFWLVALALCANAAWYDVAMRDVFHGFSSLVALGLPVANFKRRFLS